MKTFDAKVDAYINGAAGFAKPILEYWRNIIHETCTEVEEAVKWGFPHFEYKGDNLCVIAAYSKHCSFTFLKAELMSDARLKASKDLKPIQRFLGKVTKLADLPPHEEFTVMLKEAMQLNESGVKIKKEKPETEKPKVLETPDYLQAALDAHPKAKAIFESKSNSFSKDYLVWITGAKTEATRNSRIAQSLEWIAEGKSRFWQYEKKV